MYFPANGANMKLTFENDYGTGFKDTLIIESEGWEVSEEAIMDLFAALWGALFHRPMNEEDQ
jgi:hypothetical protein